MAITDTQKVDYLFKKLGFGLTKTDISVVKSASNESIASPLLVRADTIWQQSALIPTSIPTSNSSVVALYSDAIGNTIKAVNDVTSSANRTWTTGLIDWIDSSFGATYQVKVYLAPSGTTTPQTTGTQLFSDGSGSSDEWFFDYQSGVLNFIGESLPPLSFSGNSIFISGARYIGLKGINAIGNIIFSNTTISTSNSNSNLYLTSNANVYITPPGGYIFAGGSIISNVAMPVNQNDVVTLAYLNGATVANANVVIQGDTSIRVTDTGANGRIQITADSILVGNITANATQFFNTVNISNLSFSSDTITSIAGNINLTPTGNGIVKVTGTTALGLPVGDIASRPTNPTVGWVRYNTDSASIEYWSGSDWVTDKSVITSQVITPDGNSTQYTLSTTTTTNGVIVTINGTVQQPATSYNVNGNIITFAETLPITDVVEVRTIAAGQVIASSIGDITANVHASLGNVSIVGNLIVQPNGTIKSSTIYGNLMPTTSNVGNIGSSSSYFNRVFAQTTSAVYADLAENYVADAWYAPGTVLQFGGDYEVTISSNETTRVAGVVSTAPAYLMSSTLNGANIAPIALQGRVPCRVIGTVSKGDMLTSSDIPGVAKTSTNPKFGSIIGKSLENFTSNNIGIIEIVVGRL